MKHQNTYQAILPVAALALVFSACTFEQEDFFEESASLRIQHTNENVKNILCQGSGSDQNGWLIQYFVAGTEDYDFEGFNLFGRFYDNGKVTLSGNHRYLRNGNAGKFTEYTSFYEMLAEEGPVLCFDTWNDVLTVFVDPVNPAAAPGSLVNDGEGMHGDDRLVLYSFNENEINFRGERYTAPVRFVRLDCSPEEYIALSDAAKTVFAGGRVDEYRLTNGTATRFIAGISKGYFDYEDRLDDPLDKSVKSCVFTPNGFRTRDPFVLGNDTVQEFTLDKDNERLFCGNVEMFPCWERAIRKFLEESEKLNLKEIIDKKKDDSKVVKITADEACESFATLINKLELDIQSAFPTQSFKYMTFNTSSEKPSNARTGLIFYVSTNTSYYLTGFTGTVVKDDINSSATISIDVNDPSSNYNNYDKKGIGSSFTDIINVMNGTYSLTVDNKFNPTRILWTKVNDPSFYFVTNF